MSIENEYHLTEETGRQTEQYTRIKWGRLALVSPLLFTVLIAACARGTTSQIETTPTPIPVEDADLNDDGIVDVLDARIKLGDLPVFVDFNNDRIVDGKDSELVRMRVGTRPEVPLYDVDGKGDGTTCADVAIVERHLGETVEADPDSRRLRDQDYYANQMVIHFEFRQETPETPFGQKTPAPQELKEIYKLIDELMEQRQYEILNRQPLTLLGKIQVIAEIPEVVLAESSLDREIKEVSQANGVLYVSKATVIISDDIIGKPQPCPENP